MEEIFPGRAFTIKNFLSDDEADALVERAEAAGFTLASLETEEVQSASSSSTSSSSTVRNHERVVLDDVDLTAEWWSRLDSDAVPRDVTDNSRAVALASTVRLYRYDKGQKFSRHFDGYSYGSVQYQQASASKLQPKWSLLVYLNDHTTFQGGRTRFFGVDGQLDFSVQPEKGMALLYHHNLLHDGETLKAGRKYCARTDILFRIPDDAKLASTCIVQ